MLSRKQPFKDFLTPLKLTIGQAFRGYKTWCEQDSLDSPLPSKSTFRKFYIEKIIPEKKRLGKLRTDCCEKCLLLHQKCQCTSGTDRKEAEKEKESHISQFSQEEETAQDFNMVAMLLQTSDAISSGIFKRDADPASNCLYSSQLVHIGSEPLLSIIMSLSTLLQ